MPRTEPTQLNVRSSFARRRVHELVRQTGMTATEIVEDALRGYVPPASAAGVGRLVRRGPVLVCPASGRKVTLAEANAALKTVREQTD
jgi:hypothetical protein